MAANGEDSAAQDDQTCSPCRGTGKVISRLGGNESTVDCPWCKGSGRRIPGYDAQERFSSAESQSGGEDETAPE